MNWLAHTKTILLNPSEPDLEDRTFWVPFFGGLDSLEASIQAVGIINRPLVREQRDGRLVPVLGRRRLAAAAQIGMRNVEALAASADLSEPDGYALAVWDNAGTRLMDPACVAVVVRRLLELHPKETVAQDYLPLLGVPPFGPRLSRLAAIGALELPILEALSTGRIHEKTAGILADLSSSERLELFDLTTRLGLNANRSAEVAATLADLSIFEGRPVTELLRHESCREILAEVGLPRSERADRFRSLLRSWRHPELTDRERDFRQWSEEVCSDSRFGIRPAQAFESNGCTVEIRTRSRSEAETIVRMLTACVPARKDSKT